MEISGMCVSPGTAKGILVKYRPDRKYSKQDIVLLDEWVTQNITYLKDAAALLSSTGGLTCHASIIAREFSIPCLVSVKGIENVKEGTKLKVDAAAEEVTLDED